ncbi:MAG: hypothetical protein SFV53_00435 [Rickettsiales bacterium]|nr:hypothetical protein [Rickettsiales bacterium]
MINNLSLKIQNHRSYLQFLLILVPVIYGILGKSLSVAIFAAITAIVVALDYMRHGNIAVKNLFEKIFNLVLKPEEIAKQKLSPASWLVIAICVNFLFFSPEIAVTAFLILAISDSSATIIGKKFPSQPFFEKTLNGSIAFLVTAVIILIFCGLIYHARFWFYFFGLFAVVVITLMEARPTFTKIDDNFVIPIAFSTVMTMFDLIWNHYY